jgi:hypothetical protein
MIVRTKREEHGRFALVRQANIARPRRETGQKYSKHRNLKRQRRLHGNPQPIYAAFREVAARGLTREIAQIAEDPERTFKIRL